MKTLRLFPLEFGLGAGKENLPAVNHHKLITYGPHILNDVGGEQHQPGGSTMKTLRLFPLEFGRLLRSRLTWLVMLLTVLGPVAGLYLYQPAESTMNSLYLANPAIAAHTQGLSQQSCHFSAHTVRLKPQNAANSARDRSVRRVNW